MKLFLRHITLFLLFMLSTFSMGQNYPIQTFVNIAPPHTSYLPDYADPFDTRMKIILTNTDFAAPTVVVKLRVKITSQTGGWSMVTTDLTNMPSYTLSPGVPVEISGSDLLPYLDTDFLTIQGLDVAQYESTKVLPEGPALVCVEVLDWFSGNQALIGNPACATTWFAKYQPPIIATPQCGKVFQEFEIVNPPMIMFNWTPLHMSSPNSGGTNYKFQLFKVFDPNIPPNMQVFGPVLYEEITPNTYLNFSLQAPLEVGADYVWRVQAFEANGRDLFENNGWTEVCTFTYGNAEENAIAGITLNLQSNGTGARQGTTWWDGSNVFDHYILEVRKTGNPNYNWFPYEAGDDNYKVNSLDPETEYECRVKGVLGSSETDWSNISTFTTLAKQTFGCGSTQMPGKNPDIIPAEFLKPGDIVQVGQFEMRVTAADPGSQPGMFTGYGKIEIPFMFMNMNVEYEDLLVDEDLQVRGGKVEAITQGVDAWMDDQFTIFIEGTIDQISSNPVDSIFVFTLADGDTMHIEWPTNGPVTYEDESGKVITIFPDGTFTIDGQYNWDNDQLAASADYQITFHEATDQAYGFDEHVGILEWQIKYPVIQLDDGSLYWVPWKSVGSNQTDKVIAKLTGNIGVPTFADKNGANCPATQLTDSTYEVTVGNITNAGIQVYAYDSQGQKVGKLNLLNYSSKNLDVVIVPVNGVAPPSEQALQTELNNVFGQAYAFFNVTVASNFSYADDLGTNGVDAPDATLMSKYSEEMRNIRDAYFADSSNTYGNQMFVFVVDDIEGELDGYMVRGKAVGFVEAGQPLSTFAHELGHGAFGLRHTFPQVSQGSTNNLMDYHDPQATDFTHLTASQWKEIHDWDINWSILDDEEDGSLYGGYNLNLDLLELFNENDYLLDEKVPGNLFNTEDIFVLANGIRFTFSQEQLDVLNMVYFKNGVVERVNIGGEIYRPVLFQYSKTDISIPVDGEEGFYTKIKNKTNSYYFACVSQACKLERAQNMLTFDGSSLIKTSSIISKDFQVEGYNCSQSEEYQICIGSYSTLQGRELVYQTKKCSNEGVPGEPCNDDLIVLEKYIQKDLEEIVKKIEVIRVDANSVFGFVNVEGVTASGEFASMMSEKFLLLRAIRGYEGYAINFWPHESGKKYSNYALDNLSQRVADTLSAMYSSPFFIHLNSTSKSTKEVPGSIDPAVSYCNSYSFAVSEGHSDLMIPGWTQNDARNPGDDRSSLMACFRAIKKPFYIHNVYESIDNLSEQIISNITDGDGKINFQLGVEKDVPGLAFIAQANSFYSQKKIDFDAEIQITEDIWTPLRADIEYDDDVTLESILEMYVYGEASREEAVMYYCLYNEGNNVEKTSLYVEKSKNFLNSLDKLKGIVNQVEPEVGGNQGWVYQELDYHELKERTLLDQDKTLSFHMTSITGFSYSLSVFFDNQEAGIDEADYYDFDGMEEFVDPIVYGVADVISIMGSPFGLDVVGDGLGALYAGIRGQGFEFTLYSASAVLPFVNPAALKGTTKLVYAVKKGITNAKNSDIVIKNVADLSPDYIIVSNKVGVTDVDKGIIHMSNNKSNLDMSQINKRLQVKQADILFSQYQNLKNLDEFTRASIASKNFDHAALTKLDTDCSSSSFKSLIESDSELLNSWEKLINHPQLRVDSKVLTNLEICLQDNYLKTLNLDEVISNKWTKHGFGCETCTAKNKPWISELLEGLQDFKQYQNLPGYETVISQLLSQGKNQAVGSHWVMRFCQEKQLSPAKFEDFIDEATGDFSADIIVGSGNNKLFIECKSWGNKPPGMSNMPNQLINYFNTQSSLSKFQFQFDPSRWTPTPEDLNQALKSNASSFNTDANSWNKYLEMMDGEINDIPIGDTDALIDEITSPEIFSQIINPQ